MKKNLFFLAILLVISLHSNAQIIFEEQTGANNPFNGTDVGAYASPSFVDIDNDGDFDVFVGEEDGTIIFFKNEGSPEDPIFTMQSGADNPLNGIDAISYIGLDFADIDNDGDFDLFIGNVYAEIWYFENTGDNQNPIFLRQYEEDNPLNIYEEGFEAKPEFVDIDNDGDLDVFIGDDYGVIRFYENTGNESNPLFTQQTGNNNPLDGIYVGDFAKLAFADLDNDNDFDLVIGEDAGLLHYFMNTGNTSNPLFEQQSGDNNPFNDFDAGTESKPDFIDINNDGLIDLFAGNENGNILYYKNYSDFTNAPLFPAENTLLYPNPTSDFFVIESKASDKLNIKLYDAIGNLLLQNNDYENKEVIDIQMYNKGVYLIEITTADKNFVKKIIIN